MKRLMFATGVLWIGISQFICGQTARLDTTFYSFGLQYQFSNFTPKQLLCMPDGSILIVGNNYEVNNERAIQIVGLTPNGEVNASFGNGGAIRFLGEVFEIDRWPFQATPDGGFILLDRPQSPNDEDSIRVHKFTANGQPDSLFGTFGVRNAIPTRYSGGLCIYPDGRYAIGGSNPYPNSGFGKIARYLPNGSRDLSLNGTGIQEHENLEGRLAVQTDGKLVINDRYGHLLRFKEEGGLDESFGENGYSASSGFFINTTYEDLFIAENGRLLWAGGGLVRALNDQGFPDVGFGQNSIVMATGGKYSLLWNKVREMPDHRIVFQGASPRPDNPDEITYSVEMLKANGQRDTSWFGGALAFPEDDFVFDFAVQGNNLIVLRVDREVGVGLQWLERYIPGEPSSHSVQGDWSIFPNPSDYGFNIVLELDARQFVDLALFDVQGRRVDHIASGGMMDAGRHELEYQYPWDLAPGVYLAVLTLDDDQRVKKVVKIGDR